MQHLRGQVDAAYLEIGAAHIGKLGFRGHGCSAHVNTAATDFKIGPIFCEVVSLYPVAYKGHDTGKDVRLNENHVISPTELLGLGHNHAHVSPICVCIEHQSKTREIIFETKNRTRLSSFCGEP